MLGLESELTPKELEAIDLMTQKFYDARLSDQKIAEKLGISRQTLHNWKKKPEFNEELIKQSKEISRATLPTGLAYINRTLNNPRVKDSTKVKLVELILKQNAMLKDVQETEVVLKQSEEIDKIIADFKALGTDLTE